MGVEQRPGKAKLSKGQLYSRLSECPPQGGLGLGRQPIFILTTGRRRTSRVPGAPEQHLWQPTNQNQRSLQLRSRIFGLPVHQALLPPLTPSQDTVDTMAARWP